VQAAKHIVTINSVEPRSSVSLRRWKLRVSERLADVRFCRTFSPDVLSLRVNSRGKTPSGRSVAVGERRSHSHVDVAA